MIQDNRISLSKWTEVLFWYRQAPHQVEAATLLYDAICAADPCLMDQHAEWFLKYQERDKLVKNFMHVEGE